MKTTIFTRMFFASLLPLLLIFASVIGTISNIVYNACTSFAEQISTYTTEHAAGHMSEKLDGIARVLDMGSRKIGELDYRTGEVTPQAVAALTRLMAGIPSLNSAWVVFLPGVISGEAVGRAVTRSSDKALEFDNIPLLSKIFDRAPWRRDPLAPKRPYLDFADNHKYGFITGEKTTFTLFHPIVRGEEIVGVLGGVVNYGDIFCKDVPGLLNEGRALLISRDGRIVYSDDKALEGRNVFDSPIGHADDLRSALAAEKSWTGNAFLPDAGEEFLVYMHVVENPGIGDAVFLYLATPTKNIYSAARSTLELTISTGILGLLLLGFSAFVTARGIVRPIRRLSGNFEKVSSGEIESISPNDAEQTNTIELEVLQTSLAKMLTQIAQTHELRIKAAEEHMEKEKALAELRARNGFFAKMSHEIRTPMNAITGIAAILLHGEGLDGQNRKYVGDIKTSAEYLLTIVNDILDFSSLESGKLGLSETNFDFRRFLDNIRTTGELLAASNHLEFIYKTDGDLPVWLHGDDVRLRQILLNLLGNACKFTLKGSVTFAVCADEKTLKFMIADTGSGIKKEELAGIFEPFTRVDDVRNRTAQGTGLGLSIAKALLDMMGGFIAVESEYGRGSAFTVTIPKTAGDKADTRQEREAGRTFYRPGVKVLVVDDNEINRMVAEGLLTELYGFQCDLASSGAEALEKCADAEYHVILMDQMMPEMDGPETTRRIRAGGGRCSGAPIIALTANAVQGVREALLEAGLDDYLTKPINVEELDAALARWIPGEWKADAPAETDSGHDAVDPAV